MKIYTLLETFTDTIGPSVAVYRTAEEAIQAGRHDIAANGTVIIDEGSHDDVVWTCTHCDGMSGQEFITEVKEHEL